MSLTGPVGSLREKEDALFDKWKCRHYGFLRDGAGSAFAVEETRAVFLLKEAVAEVGGEESSWDLRDFINDGARWMTWNNIARWAAFVLDDVTWDEVRVLNTGARASIIRRVAGVNLKKVPGASTSDMAEIWRFATQDAEFVRDQIALYKPQLLIACGTFWIAERVFGLDGQQRRACGPRHYHVLPNGGVLIEFMHPQARGYQRAKFEEFAEVIGSLRAAGVLPSGSRRSSNREPVSLSESSST